MLFLHCGWPRTGTTSLQAAVREHRALLAEASIVYPDRWLDAQGQAHHRLNELLDDDAPGALEDLQRFLGAHTDRDVLLSAESFTGRLRREERFEALLALLAAARGSMPVTCLWTLRRVDEMLASGFLMQLKLGRGSRLPLPAEHIAAASPHSERTFERMRRVGEAVDDAVHVKYAPDGVHNRELLRALGLEPGAVEALGEALERAPRRNVSPFQKEAAVLANHEAVAHRAGVALDLMALCRTFARREFRFEQDWPCELVAREVKEAVHRRTLAAAREQGFAPYGELFADEAIGMASPIAGLDPEILTDRDLERLLAHLERDAPARLPG